MALMYFSLLFSALALVLAAVSFLYFKSYLKRRTGQERILSEMREEVDSIMREMDGAVERDISLIEERKRNLKTLLDDIDRRLKVYVREMEKLKNAEETSAALSQKNRAPEQAPKRYQDLGNYRLNRRPAEERRVSADMEASSDPPGPGNYLLTESKYYAPTDDTGGLAAGNGPAFPLPGFSVKPEAGPGPLREGNSPDDPAQSDTAPLDGEIRSMIRAGFPAPLIASRLGISIAEVEFAAALLERRDAL